MAHGIIRVSTIILAGALLSPVRAHAQNQPTAAPANAVDLRNSWENASSTAPSSGKLLIITRAQPTHRIACHIQSFTLDQLTCKEHSGKSRIYKLEEIAALMVPVISADRPRFSLGLKIATAGIILGEIAVAGLCGPCGLPIDIASLVVFGMDLARIHRGERSYSYLYIAPADKLYDPKGNRIRLKPLP